MGDIKRDNWGRAVSPTQEAFDALQDQLHDAKVERDRAEKVAGAAVVMERARALFRTCNHDTIVCAEWAGLIKAMDALELAVVEFIGGAL